MILKHAVSTVIFDLDGTLLDTEPLYSKATEGVLRRFGKEYSFDLKARCMGRDARYGAALVIETLGLPLGVDQYLDERRSLLFSLFQDTVPLPGAVELVEELKSARIPLGIATSSSRELCAIKLKNKPWVEHFSTVIFGDDVRVRKLKPDPDLFLLAASELGVTPRDCVVFEDSPAGVEAALAAGMQVIALPDPRHDRRSFARATKIVDGYHQISLADLGFASSPRLKGS